MPLCQLCSLFNLSGCYPLVTCDNDSDVVDVQNYDLFELEMKQYLAGEKFRPYLFAVNNLEGPQSNLPQIISYMPTKSQKDYENIIARLTAFPTQAQQIVELLLEGRPQDATTTLYYSLLSASPPSFPFSPALSFT